MKGSVGRIGRAAIGAVALYALTATPGCGGGGGGGTLPPSVAASFAASGTAAAPDKVRLRSASATGNLVVIEVAIGGPTTSTDLYSFAFDLVLSDATVASYVAASATFGNALTLSGGQTSVVEATQSGNRLVVGVTKAGPGARNGVASVEAVVVALTFRVLKVGTTNVTFSGAVSAENPTGGPAALDSNLALVPSVQFDATAAAITGTY